MRVVVFGAAGGVGRELVGQALAGGHEVTAFVHHQADDLPAGVRQVEGDVLDAGAVRHAVAGQDAVFDAIGGSTPWKRTGLEPDAALNIVEAMRAEGVRRLVVTSAMGVGDSGEVVASLYEYLLVPTFLRGTMKDKTQMEADLASATDLDWIVVRPAGLTDGEVSEAVRTYEPGGGETAHTIARTDVAAFMIGQLSSDAHLRQAVNIATS